MNYKVLLLTSGIGSRLGDVIKYTNKSLVRVGEKPAICHIIDKYPEEIEFVIALGYFGDQVRDFLGLAYPEKIFHFVNVENYQGLGSSVLCSILCAEKEIDRPFIIHACDTLVPEDNIPDPNVNWLGGQRTPSNDMYTSFDMENSKRILKVYKKGKEHSDYACIGLAGIKDFKEFFERAKELYKENGNDEELSNIHVHASLIESNVYYEGIIFSSWLDTGNLNGLRKAREYYSDSISNLNKESESIFKVNDRIIKFFFNKDMVEKRVERGNILGKAAPEILGKSGNFFSYKYIEGEKLDVVIDEKLMKKFLEWSKFNLWKKSGKRIDNFSDICYEFYFKKTERRIWEFLNKYDLKDDIQSINGFVVPKVFDMILDLPQDQLCNVINPYNFHGDFILDNVIFTGNDFKLIDWRQDFGGDLVWGDIYYDLSKLNCSLIFNQGIVRGNNFIVQQVNDNINVDIYLSYNLLQCKKVFLEFLKENNFDSKKIDLITSIIWLNMSPLHKPPLDRFLYYFGKLNLYKALKGRDLL